MILHSWWRHFVCVCECTVTHLLRICLHPRFLKDGSELTMCVLSDMDWWLKSWRWPRHSEHRPAGVLATWWCWWTAGRRSTVYLWHILSSFNRTPLTRSAETYHIPPSLTCKMRWRVMANEIKLRQASGSAHLCHVGVLLHSSWQSPCLCCPWRRVSMTDCRPTAEAGAWHPADAPL